MLGVAIGLGNVWRFPYMMGQYGGSAFLLVYLLFTFIFAIPALTAEWALGRETRRGPFGAFSKAFGPTAGGIIAVVLLVTVLVADSYYLMVIANIAYSSVFSITQGFSDETMALYDRHLANGGLQYVIGLGILIATLIVLYRGLQKGIEAASKLFVPFFGIVVVSLVVTALSMDGALSSLWRFLNPDFSNLGKREVFAALGQAFFSIGLGGTFLLMYGSYLDDRQKLPVAAVLTALGDTGAAMLAALFIVPSILVFGLNMEEGPTLIFSTLPKLFDYMPGGRFFGSLFLLALSLVAFLSNVAALEVISRGLRDWGRVPLSWGKLLAVVGIVEALLMLPSALNPKLIGVLDLIFGSGMQVLGSALAVLGLTFGLGRRVVFKQIFGGTPRTWHRVYFIWIKWILPAALFLILLGYIESQITKG